MSLTTAREEEGDGGKDEDGTGEEKGEEETGRAWEGKVAVWRPKYTGRRR